MDSGSTEIEQLAAMIEAAQMVDVRLALVRVHGMRDGWKIRYGDVLLGAEVPRSERLWRYPDDIFLQRRLPGSVVAALVQKQPQQISDLRVIAPTPQSNGSFRRLSGQTKWNHEVLPWPRMEWEISPSKPLTVRPSGVLVGDGPAFLDAEAAFCSFFHAAAPNHSLRARHALWRIVRLDRRAWIYRVTIAPDSMTVVAKGAQLAGVRVELSTPTGRLLRPLARSGRIRLRLGHGLTPDTLLLLRNEDDWLDFRYFPSPMPGQHMDASLVWDLPGAEVSVLVSGGENQHVEFKREVPTAEPSKKQMLKTVAAFASGGGGTVVVGVDDHAQVVGIDPETLDSQILRLQQMIRNSIDPEPPYDVRAAELDGKTVLLVEVTGGKRWHALNRDKPEFYLRRGASTVPARVAEIAAGFGG